MSLSAGLRYYLDEEPGKGQFVSFELGNIIGLYEGRLIGLVRPSSLSQFDKDHLPKFSINYGYRFELSKNFLVEAQLGYSYRDNFVFPLKDINFKISLIYKIPLSRKK